MEENSVLFNCVELKGKWPADQWYKDVMLVTDCGKKFPQILNKHGISVRQIKQLYTYSYTKKPRYTIRLIRYPKRLNQRIEEVFHDLELYMLAFGYPDYEEVCDEIFASTDEMVSKK